MIRKKGLLLLLLVLVLVMARTYAQNTSRTITGTVLSSDESGPVEGVLVTVKGTNRVSGSQADGVYYIPVTNKDSVLVFSHSEFKTQEVKLSASNEYNITLQKKGEQAAAQKCRLIIPLHGNGGIPAIVWRE